MCNTKERTLKVKQKDGMTKKAKNHVQKFWGLWPIFRSSKDPLLLLLPWWGTNHISRCCSGCFASIRK